MAAGKVQCSPPGAQHEQHSATESISSKRSSRERCAAYVRMSTAEQRNSIALQLAGIRAYAKARRWTVARVYADEGKSGLTLNGRPALKELLTDVMQGQPAYRRILVYDISRWGRFQDADESAHYEFLCRSAGVDVIYCAEPLIGADGPYVALLKSLKRAMAGEFSSELSRKTHLAQSRLARRGHLMGGFAGYGYRRAAVDEQGRVRSVFDLHERKANRAHATRLVPGPPAEVQTVRLIFRLFVEQRWSRKRIARHLNARGSVGGYGKEWSGDSVNKILTSRRYVGTIVYNRVSRKLRGPTVKNEPSSWIRAKNAHSEIVDKATFDEAQSLIAGQRAAFSPAGMIAHLRTLLAENGRLSRMMIEADRRCPSASAYVTRFGSLNAAYALVGYRSARSKERFSIERSARSVCRDVREKVIDSLRSKFGEVTERDQFAYVKSTRQRLLVKIAPAFGAMGEPRHWCINVPRRKRFDHLIVARLANGNEGPRDCFIVPRSEAQCACKRLYDGSVSGWDVYRVPSIDDVPRRLRELERAKASASL